MASEKHVPSLCPKFERAFQLIGKKWNGLIIESLFRQPLRFGELRDSITGISDRVLIERLRQLNGYGMVVKEDVEADGRKYSVYRLTEKGMKLQPVFNQLHDWADVWMEQGK